MDYDIYGMPTIWDYKTDPNNPTVVNNSTIGNNYLYHGRRYDPETNLYYYRARYYDPITGRFLSTDPMGYQDSMNLYQAFNMNGVNFLDPMGLTTYNVFFGFKQNDRGRSLSTGNYFDFPDFNELQQYVSEEDTLNIITIENNKNVSVNGYRYSSSDITKSLLAEDTETYFVGHGAHNDQKPEKYVTIQVDESEKPDLKKWLLYNPVMSKNDCVGFFACGSADFAANMARGTEVIGVFGAKNRKSSTNALSQSAYNFVKSRLQGESLDLSIKKGNKAFKESRSRKNGVLLDKGDRLMALSKITQALNILRLFIAF